MLIRQIENRRSQPPTSHPTPLEPRQCEHLAAVVAELGPNWSVELHDDIPGKETIVILPDDPDEAIGPTLIIHADESAFHLEELDGDAFRKLGEHLVWADVLRAVRIRLVWEMPFPTTRH
jgi:hypothetical protein